MNTNHQNTIKAGRTRSRGGVRLQVRDIHILEALVERRCETLDYLHEHFFAGLSRKRALGRLRDLQRAGLINRVGDLWLWDLYGPVSIYHLTRGRRRCSRCAPRSAIISAVVASARSGWMSAGPSRSRSTGSATGSERSCCPNRYSPAPIRGDATGAAPTRSTRPPNVTGKAATTSTSYLRQVATENLRQALRYDELERLQLLTIEMVREGGWRDPGTQPQGGHSWQARPRPQR